MSALPGRARRLRDDEAGSVAAELTLLAPLLVLLLLVVVLCGRVVTAQLAVQDAASHAARAATLARTPEHARTAAATATRATLAPRDCGTLHAEVADAGPRPGATVTVTVHCRLALADLTLLAVPGTVDVDATASSIVDRWRSQP